MCLGCLMIERENTLLTPRELVNNLTELNITDSHKESVYDLAMDKANELGLNDYGSELAGAISRDLLRKT